MPLSSSKVVEIDIPSLTKVSEMTITTVTT